MQSKLTDFEDAVLDESASRAGLDGIVTRNEKDFKQSKLTVYNPEELLKIINSL